MNRNVWVSFSWKLFIYACTELNGCLLMGVNSNVCTTRSSAGVASSPSNFAKLLSFQRPLGPETSTQLDGTLTFPATSIAYR